MNGSKSTSYCKDVYESFIYYQNTNGLRTKTALFKQGVAINCFLIYVLIETGLYDMIFDNEVFTSDYVVYRSDRIIGTTSNKTQKGGVLIAVHKTIQSCLVENFNVSGVEQLWVKVKLGSKNVCICALYIPPKSKIDLYKAQMTCVLSMSSKVGENDICYIMGDFNLPNLVWCKNEIETDCDDACGTS